jgi:hypothetical protein
LRNAIRGFQGSLRIEPRLFSKSIKTICSDVSRGFPEWTTFSAS